MNDFAISTQTISRSGLQGLPQRLVIDGLVADTAMIDAIAAAKAKVPAKVPELQKPAEPKKL